MSHVTETSGEGSGQSPTAIKPRLQGKVKNNNGLNANTKKLEPEEIYLSLIR